MLGQLTIADFIHRVGEGFSINYPDHAETLWLENAEAGRIPPPPGMRQAFSLVFRGESTTMMLAQGTHGLVHPDFGLLELFLTCIGPDQEGRFQYQAVFT